MLIYSRVIHIFVSSVHEPPFVTVSLVKLFSCRVPQHFINTCIADIFVVWAPQTLPSSNQWPKPTESWVPPCIPTGSFPESLPAYLPAPSPCPLLRPWDVYKALAKIKHRSACGPDGISTRLINEFAVELATPLTHILNTSFQQVKSPDVWKRATVIPIPKTTPPTLEKLRLISLTDHFAKVAEGFIVKWFLGDLKPKLDPNQFGNRNHLSTSHCLINCIHVLFAHADIPKSSSSVVITDFTKAFDRIDHTIAISKMISQGVQPAIIGWIADFLTGRSQNVRYHSTVSDWSAIHAGVPQGTRLGPLIFLSMINDVSPPHGIKAFKYVDDMILVETRTSAQPSRMQEAVTSLTEWYSNNNMSLNPSKGAFMLNFWGRNQRFQTWLEQNAVASMLIFE